MIYPHFCCVIRQKAELRKTPLSEEIPLCSLVPPESLRAIFAPLRSALCRWLLSARFVIGHRTVALRHRQCASALRRERRGCENATLLKNKKNEKTKNKKSFVL